MDITKEHTYIFEFAVFLFWIFHIFSTSVNTTNHADHICFLISINLFTGKEGKVILNKSNEMIKTKATIITNRYTLLATSLHTPKLMQSSATDLPQILHLNF